MSRLLWLPDVLRAAGLTVVEVSGWRVRGSSTFDPRGIICHETRGSRNSTDAGEINVLLHGSNTAPPPIAQLYLSRTGKWHVVASGRCNHVRVGWAGPFKGVGNTGLIGIEAQHALGEPWTDKQYDSYVRGVAAIRRRTGWGVAGHKEHQPGGYGHASSKTDPSFDMGKFRAAVSARLAGGDDDMPLAGADKKFIQDAVHGMMIGNSGVWAGAVLDSMRTLPSKLDAILAAVLGDADAERISAEIREQGEQTRAALLAKLTELAPTLAREVADRLGPEAAAGEIGEAIARELAEMLATAPTQQG